MKPELRPDNNIKRREAWIRPDSGLSLSYEAQIRPDNSLIPKRLRSLDYDRIASLISSPQ